MNRLDAGVLYLNYIERLDACVGFEREAIGPDRPNLNRMLIDGPILERIPDSEKSGFTGLKMLMNYLGFALGNYAAGWFLESGKGYAPIYYTAAALAFIQLFIYVGGLMGPMEKGRESLLPAHREGKNDSPDAV